MIVLKKVNNIKLNKKFILSIMSVYTAIVTPFNEDGSIDYESFDNLIKFQISNKIDGIVIFGTTGESPTLTLEEKFSLMDRFEVLFKENPEYFDKVIIGFGGNCTKKVIEDMSEFKKYDKFNNYMLSTPYYNKPTQKGLFYHFTTIMSGFSDKKFLIYNIPGRTGVNMLPETIISICDVCENYIGVKEASGDLSQAYQLISAGIPTFSGDDNLAYDIVTNGGCGVVSVASNLFPTKVVENLETNKSFEEGFLESMFLETNPGPIKYYMKMEGIIKNDNVRLPLVKPEKETIEKLNKFIKKSPGLHQE